MSLGSARTGTLAGLLTGIQVGAALFASQIVVADLGAGMLGVLRYGIAMLVLLPFLFVKPGPRLAPHDRIPVLLLGLGQVGVMIALLEIAVSFTSAAGVALIVATLPAVTLLIGTVLGRTVGGPVIGLGIALTMAGVAVLLGQDALTGGMVQTDMVGMSAAGLATVIVATCSSIYQPYVRRYGAIKLSVIAFGVSLLPLSLLAVWFPPVHTAATLDTTVWGLTLAIGLSSGLGYLMWFHAIEHLTAPRVTGFLALSPITAAALSLIFLDTPISPTLLASLALVSTGLLCLTCDVGESRPADYS